jgi:lysine 2,3-aminomutase
MEGVSFFVSNTNVSNEEISLIRASELRAYALPYLDAKKNISFGMDFQTASQRSNAKTLILEHLKATTGDFDNWKWQFSNRFSSIEDLGFYFDFTEKEKIDISSVTKKYRFSATPYYMSLIDQRNVDDPIKKMALTSVDELDERGMEDPTQEERTNPCGVITRRYPDRLILNVTNTCAMYCRHCLRRRKIGEVDTVSSSIDISASIEYIKQNPEIRDVLVTGGDPLTLSDEFLDDLLGKIRSIPHVQIIRIGTRTPVTMPQRITLKLAEILKKHHPLYINTQFNHPTEITEESRRACVLLADHRVSLGNQMVLLKGVNDDKHIVRYLNEELLCIHVRPYYIYHPKKVVGTSHFYVSIKKGLAIMEYLRGNTSGLAIPNYVLNAPGGLGKCPLPKSIIEHSENVYKIRNWEGKVFKYPDEFE